MHQRIDVVETVLNTEKISDSVQHRFCINFSMLISPVHPCSIRESKMEVEKVVYLRVVYLKV